MKTIYLDIETVALPVEQRQASRPKMDTISLGNLKDPAKIEAKLQSAIIDWERGTDAALDPVQGQIAIVGIMHDTGKYTEISGRADLSEKQMLEEAWSILAPTVESGTDLEIIGHNVIQFDAVFMVKRSWILGVPVPRVLLADLYQRQPRHWKDTMRLWSLGVWPPEYVKLTAMAGALGIEAKAGEITGATFGEWWAKDKAACVEYNKSDLVAVKACHERMQGA